MPEAPMRRAIRFLCVAMAIAATLAAPAGAAETADLLLVFAADVSRSIDQQKFQLQRDEALAKGVTINGLVILSERPLSWNAEHTNPPGGLDKYYQDNVIGGPGAFVMVAEDFNSFGQAIINKMIAEIAAAPQRGSRALAALLDDPALSGPATFRTIGAQ